MQELKVTKQRIIGLKQTIKAIKEDRGKKVYIAKDAADNIKNNIIRLCNEKENLEIVYVNTMKELGEACGIEVNASTALLLKS